jgi:hypothetical protein
MYFHARRFRARREATIPFALLIGTVATGGAGCSMVPSSTTTDPVGSAATGGGASANAGASAGTSARAGTGPGTGGAGNAPSTSGGMSAVAGGAGGVATTGGAAGKASSEKAPTVSGILVEPNPTNTLSCFVSWTTDTASNSEVQFGVEGYQFHIVQNESVTAHRVLVIGMHAETSYLVKAVSTNSAGTSSSEATFTTGALPNGLPVATQTAADTSGAQSGWTLINVMPAGGHGFVGTEPGIMVMYDMQGQPVWYFVNGSTPDARGDVSLRVLANHNLILGPSSGEPAKELDLAGQVVWQGPPPAPTTASTDPAMAPMSHYADKLANGNYVVLRDLSNSAGIVGALVEELSPDNEVVWSWNLFDHKQPPGDANMDWCHPNSVTVDLANDVFYLSCRYQGIFKAKRSGDQALLWQLGGQAGGDFMFDPESAAIFDQHDPEIHDDGTILVFDNHYGYGSPPAGTTSRVIEFKLDEDAKVARPTFEFPGSYSNVDGWYKDTWLTPYWGDADRMKNGNVLVCAGERDSTGQTHVFEVRPSDGAVVWQITLPMGAGSYQAERLSPPPFVEPL